MVSFVLYTARRDDETYEQGEKARTDTGERNGTADACEVRSYFIRHRATVNMSSGIFPGT